jgi:hypothetical protein
MIDPAAQTSKQCTGAKLAGEVLTSAHEAALADFNRYSASPDGLDRICRTCWSTYEKTRKARKAGQAAPATGEPLVPVPAGPTYANERAELAHRGRLGGYASELIGGVIYALPESPDVVGTPEGQAALAACNEARGAERRRLDRERKREQRARAKAAAAEA